MNHSLVLNQNYLPLGITSYKRALKLFLKGKVEILENYQDEILTVSARIPKPSVIRLNKLISGFRVGLRYNRHNVYLRDRGKCSYCGLKIPENKATIDHIVPKSKGGTTNFLNVTTACISCNLKKDSKTLKEASMILLNKPSIPSFLPVEIAFQLKYNQALPDTWKNWLPNA